MIIVELVQDRGLEKTTRFTSAMGPISQVMRYYRISFEIECYTLHVNASTMGSIITSVSSCECHRVKLTAL